MSNASSGKLAFLLFDCRSQELTISQRSSDEMLLGNVTRNFRIFRIFLLSVSMIELILLLIVAYCY